uniref:Pre T-cell antigen receptor alpha n=1 Tax=Ursus maritimus TaxID=29073 RepID=A0A452TVV1_URSMA
MAGTWLLLLLALGCPALPTGVGGTPFPSLAPPITLLVDGKQQTLVVCLVLDVAPPGLESPIWFSADNGSSLDAFTYGPSPEADGTWTSLAQLSLPSEELAAWENLVCHTGPKAGDRSQSTRPLQLSGGDGAWAPVGPTEGSVKLSSGSPDGRCQHQSLGRLGGRQSHQPPDRAPSRVPLPHRTENMGLVTLLCVRR